jgi:catechol 2,3-dioxygenase-like lactoylglutathione lyase family enzyme
MNALLRGVFLTSENLARTADFYRDVAGLELERVGNANEYVYWRIDKNGVQLAIHDARAFAEYTNPAKLDSNVTHLYFKVDSQAGFLAHLKDLGAVPCSVDDVVVTVVDPDGRRVMFGTA